MIKIRQKRVEKHHGKHIEESIEESKKKNKINDRKEGMADCKPSFFACIMAFFLRLNFDIYMCV